MLVDSVLGPFLLQRSIFRELPVRRRLRLRCNRSKLDTDGTGRGRKRNSGPRHEPAHGIDRHPGSSRFWKAQFPQPNLDTPCAILRSQSRPPTPQSWALVEPVQSARSQGSPATGRRPQWLQCNQPKRAQYDRLYRIRLDSAFYSRRDIGCSLNQLQLRLPRRLAYGASPGVQFRLLRNQSKQKTTVPRLCALRLSFAPRRSCARALRQPPRFLVASRARRPSGKSRPGCR